MGKLSPQNPLLMEKINFVLATHNADKVKEIKSRLEIFTKCLTISSALDYPDLIEVEETEPTLEGNAILKATSIYDQLNAKLSPMLVMADDTGLEVAALNGAPGVYSARYACDLTPNPTYNDNVEKMLKEMASQNNREAKFRTVVALIGTLNFGKQLQGSYFEKTFEGKVLGEITNKKIGDAGFGYDPIFRVASLNKTFAEMGIEEKNEVSHRGRALKKMTDYLSQTLECMKNA